jgi:excisionase family DNA binding protein
MARLHVAEAAAYIPLSKSKLNELRIKGGGPRFIKIGKRVLYDTADLDKWIEENKRKSMSDLPTFRSRRHRAV